MDKVIPDLEKNLNLQISLLKEIDYGIKYEVTDKTDNRSGTIRVSGNKKYQYNITPERKLKEGVIDQIRKRFEERNSSNMTNQYEQEKFTNMKFIYESLKPYEREEFDFSPLADEMIKNFEDLEIKKEILKYEYNFQTLEKYYKKIMEGI